jgi:hypothetical protein
MYNNFLSFMFGILYGVAIYLFLELFNLKAFLIPIWSLVIICLFIYDKLFRKDNGK